MVKEAAGDRSLGPKTQPVQRQRTQKPKNGCCTGLLPLGRLGHFVKHCLVRWTVTLLNALITPFLFELYTLAIGLICGYGFDVSR